MTFTCEAAPEGWVVGVGVLIQSPREPRGSVCSPKLPPAMSPLLAWRRLPVITFLLCRRGRS